MMIVEEHYSVLVEVLSYSPLSPTELKETTGLSRYQIRRALLWEEDNIDFTISPKIVYLADSRLYVLTSNPVELARAAIPRLKANITRANRTLPMIEWLLTTESRSCHSSLEATKIDLEAVKDKSEGLLIEMQYVVDNARGIDV